MLFSMETDGARDGVMKKRCETSGVWVIVWGKKYGVACWLLISQHALAADDMSIPANVSLWVKYLYLCQPIISHTTWHLNSLENKLKETGISWNSDSHFIISSLPWQFVHWVFNLCFPRAHKFSDLTEKNASLVFWFLPVWIRPLIFNQPGIFLLLN